MTSLSLSDVRFRSPDPAEHAEAIYVLLNTHWAGIDGSCRNGRIAHRHLDEELVQAPFSHQHPQMPSEAL